MDLSLGGHRRYHPISAGSARARGGLHVVHYAESLAPLRENRAAAAARADFPDTPSFA